MSTTPMYRPFLVGHNSGRENHASPHSVSQNDAMCSTADHETVYRGLHLVPATGSRTKLAGPFRNYYKIAAAAAALFLVLTVI